MCERQKSNSGLNTNQLLCKQAVSSINKWEHLRLSFSEGFSGVSSPSRLFILRLHGHRDVPIGANF